MKRGVIGIEGARVGAFAAGTGRWTRDLQRLTLVVLVGVIGNTRRTTSPGFSGPPRPRAPSRPW